MNPPVELTNGLPLPSCHLLPAGSLRRSSLRGEPDRVALPLRLTACRVALCKLAPIPLPVEPLLACEIGRILTPLSSHVLGRGHRLGLSPSGGTENKPAIAASSVPRTKRLGPPPGGSAFSRVVCAVLSASQRPAGTRPSGACLCWLGTAGKGDGARAPSGHPRISLFLHSEGREGRDSDSIR